MIDLLEIARRAEGSDLLPKVSFGVINAEDLILKLADRIEELKAELVKLEKKKNIQIHVISHSAGDWKTRAEAAEAMLPRAYRAGVEASGSRSRTYLAEQQLPLRKRSHGAELGLADAIRALPTPTSTELMARLKEKNDDRYT